MASNNVSTQPMEEYLTAMTEALTFVMGEEGLSRKILDGVRDLFRLDALEHIRTASTVEIVLNEMRQYPHDSPICFAGAEVLDRILKINEKAFIDALPDIHPVLAMHKAQESFSRAILAVKDGHEVIFSIISNHVAEKDIQKRGFLLLGVLLNHGPPDNKDAIRLLSSPRGVKAMLAALDLYPDDENAQVEALTLLKDVGRLYSSRYGFAFPNAEFYCSLAEAGVIPSLFSSIQRHASNAAVASSACRLLGDIGFGMQALDPRVRQRFLEYRLAHPEWRGVIEAARDMHPNNLSVHDSVEFMLFATTVLPRRGALRT